MSLKNMKNLNGAKLLLRSIYVVGQITSAGIVTLRINLVEGVQVVAEVEDCREQIKVLSKTNQENKLE